MRRLKWKCRLTLPYIGRKPKDFGPRAVVGGTSHSLLLYARANAPSGGSSSINAEPMTGHAASKDRGVEREREERRRESPSSTLSLLNLQNLIRGEGGIEIWVVGVVFLVKQRK